MLAGQQSPGESPDHEGVTDPTASILLTRIHEKHVAQWEKLQAAPETTLLPETPLDEPVALQIVPRNVAHELRAVLGDGPFALLVAPSADAEPNGERLVKITSGAPRRDGWPFLTPPWLWGESEADSDWVTVSLTNQSLASSEISGDAARLWLSAAAQAGGARVVAAVTTAGELLGVAQHGRRATFRGRALPPFQPGREGTPGPFPGRPQAEFRAVYELAGGAGADHSRLALHCEWTAAATCFLQCVGERAASRVEALCLSSRRDAGLDTEHLRRELDVLVLWHVLATAGDAACAAVAQTSFGGLAGSSCKNEAKTMDDFLQGERESEPANADDAAARRDLDLSERLWRFLALHTDNLVTLTRALDALVCELEDGTLVPDVSRDNRTQLASVLRDAERLAVRGGSGATADLDEERAAFSRWGDAFLDDPLAQLVELGLFKLRRDCVFALMAAGLMAPADLQPLLAAADPAAGASTWAQIALLRRLVRLVEISRLVQRHIPGVPSASLGGALRRLAQRLWAIRGAAEPVTANPSHVASAVQTVFDDALDAPLAVEFALPRFAQSTRRLVLKISRSFPPAQWSAVCDSAGVRSMHVLSRAAIFGVDAAAAASSSLGASSSSLAGSDASDGSSPFHYSFYNHFTFEGLPGVG